MNKAWKNVGDTVDDFTEALIHALDNQTDNKRKTGLNAFFASPAWFFLALFAVLVNIIMVAVIFWQRMRIDYLINKIIGE